MENNHEECREKNQVAHGKGYLFFQILTDMLFYKLQDKNTGGIHTPYSNEFEPTGNTNVETTSLVYVVLQN